MTPLSWTFSRFRPWAPPKTRARFSNPSVHRLGSMQHANSPTAVGPCIDLSWRPGNGVQYSALYLVHRRGEYFLARASNLVFSAFPKRYMPRDRRDIYGDPKRPRSCRTRNEYAQTHHERPTNFSDKAYQHDTHGDHTAMTAEINSSFLDFTTSKSQQNILLTGGNGDLTPGHRPGLPDLDTTVGVSTQ